MVRIFPEEEDEGLNHEWSGELSQKTGRQGAAPVGY